MGTLGKNDYLRQRKIRALTLMKMFEKKIKSGLFEVEVASWWSNGMDNTVILRIDMIVNNIDDLDELSQS